MLDSRKIFIVIVVALRLAPTRRLFVTAADPASSAGNTQRGSRAESKKLTWRKWVVSAGVAVIVVVFPVWGWYCVYNPASSTPSHPSVDGGLYLLVNEPNANVSEMDVAVDNPDATHPVLSVNVWLKDPKAKFALIGQGSWAFLKTASGPHVSEFDSAMLEPTSALAVNEVQPSSAAIAYVPKVNWDLPYPSHYITVTATLRGPLAADGAGRSRGELPPIQSGLFNAVHITGLAGTWSPPLPIGAINVSVAYDSLYEQVETVSPHTGSSVGLNWTYETEDPYIEDWQAANPDAADRAQQTIFLLGALLGIWGSIVVAITQLLITRFVKSQKK